MKIVFPVLASCLLLLVAACGSNRDPSQEPQAGSNSTPFSFDSRVEVPTSVLPNRDLQCHLEAKPTYRSGEPVEVLFRLTNFGTKPLWVLRWNTPFEGLIGDCFEIFRDGEVVFFEGKMIKRAMPEAWEYVSIPPGESREASVDLRAAYLVEGKGRYHLSFDTALFDVTDDESLVPRRLEEHQSFDPHCPEVVFEVR